MVLVFFSVFNKAVFTQVSFSGLESLLNTQRAEGKQASKKLEKAISIKSTLPGGAATGQNNIYNRKFNQ